MFLPFFPESKDFRAAASPSQKAFATRHTNLVMEAIAAFAIIVFLLGLFLGLLFQKAYKRRRVLVEREKNKPHEKPSDSAPLDKSSSAG